jgi:hypothetical protein
MLSRFKIYNNKEWTILQIKSQALVTIKGDNY